MRQKAIFFVLLLMLPLESLAWGRDGHQLVCALAEKQFTPEATQMVAMLTKAGGALSGGATTFVESCLWPDKVRYSSHKGSYEAHFLNVPANASTIDLHRDCPALDCIVVGIERALFYLSKAPGDNPRKRVQQAAALRFLGHYMADLHQPLHVGHTRDLGGNRIRVFWQGKSTSLHAFWDYGMLEATRISYPASLPLLAAVSPPLDDSELLQWLEESLVIARRYAYLNEHGQPVVNGTQLTRAYVARNKSIFLDQLNLGAGRLADLINRLAAGESIRFVTLRPGR